MDGGRRSSRASPGHTSQTIDARLPRQSLHRLRPDLLRGLVVSKRIEDAIALGLSLGFMLLILLIAGMILASCTAAPAKTCPDGHAPSWNFPCANTY